MKNDSLTASLIQPAEPEIEKVISFESLLVNDNDQQAWCVAEFAYPAKNQRFWEDLDCLYELLRDELVRNLKVRDREILQWHT